MKNTIFLRLVSSNKKKKNQKTDMQATKNRTLIFLFFIPQHQWMGIRWVLLHWVLFLRLLFASRLRRSPYLLPFLLRRRRAGHFWLNILSESLRTSRRHVRNHRSLLCARGGTRVSTVSGYREFESRAGGCVEWKWKFG